MSNDQAGRAGEEQIDEDMAEADRTNGERTAQDVPESAPRAAGSDREPPRADPEAPGTYVSDGEASSVAEPNEPA